MSTILVLVPPARGLWRETRYASVATRSQGRGRCPPVLLSVDRQAAGRGSRARRAAGPRPAERVALEDELGETLGETDRSYRNLAISRSATRAGWAVGSTVLIRTGTRLLKPPRARSRRPPVRRRARGAGACRLETAAHRLVRAPFAELQMRCRPPEIDRRPVRIADSAAAPLIVGTVRRELAIAGRGGQDVGLSPSAARSFRIAAVHEHDHLCVA